MLAKLLALADDPSPEVQLQLALSLGEARDPAAEFALATLARKNPTNTFLPDALQSGIHGRELALLETLLADPQWTPADARANEILGGLAKGIVNTGEPAPVERLLDLIAAVPADDARRLALLNGATAATFVTAARQLRLAAEPRALAALRPLPTAPIRTSVTKLDRLLVWPGKPGATLAFVPPPFSPAEQARFEAGRTLFAGTCLPCHQAHGRGLDGLAPPLANSEWVNGSAERVVRIALHGVRGPLKVDGRTYNLDMPPWGALRDEDLAALVTYIRREWGNTGAPVTSEFIQAQRTATKPRNEPWTQAELLKLP